MSQNIGSIETVPSTAKYDAIKNLSDHVVQGLIWQREVDTPRIPGNPAWNWMYGRNQVTGQLYLPNDEDGSYGNSHIGHGAALRYLRLHDADSAKILDYAAEYTLGLEALAVATYGSGFSGSWPFWVATYNFTRTELAGVTNYVQGQPRHAYSSDQGHMGAHYLYAYLYLLRNEPGAVIKYRAQLLDLTRRATVREMTAPTAQEAYPGYGAGTTNLFGNLLRLLTNNAEGTARSNGLTLTTQANPFYGDEYTAWKITQTASRPANASSNGSIDVWMRGLVAPDSTQEGVMAYLKGSSHDMLAMDLGRQNVTYTSGVFTGLGTQAGLYPKGWSLPASVAGNLFRYTAANTPPDTVEMGNGGSRDGLNGRVSQRAIVLGLTALYDPGATIHINETGATVNVLEALEDMLHTVALYSVHPVNGVLRYSYPGYLGSTTGFTPNITDPVFSGYALMACELYLLAKKRVAGLVSAADYYRFPGVSSQLVLTAQTSVPATPFPATLTAADYLLSPAVTPGIDPDGTLVFSSGTSSQPAALLKNERLADGQSFSATFTVDNPDSIRVGVLVVPTTTLPVPDNGLWFAVEGGVGVNSLRLLKWNNGTFNYDGATTLTPFPALVANQTYTLGISRLGDTFTVSLDGVPYMSTVQGQSFVSEEPYVGVQVGFRAAQRTYRVKPLPNGSQASAATISSALPSGADVMLRRAGRPGYSLGTVARQVLPSSTQDLELVPFLRNGSQIQTAGQSLLVPGGSGVVAAVSGAATPGAVLGFSEPSTDAALPLWDPVTPAGKFSTTVDPASRTVVMTPLGGSGYAYRSKTFFDPTQDMSIEFYGTLEQISGVGAFLGAVFHVYEEPGNVNYGGINVNRDLDFPTGGATIAALYGDEAFNQVGNTTVALGQEYLHRVVYDAAGKRLVWWMDGVYKTSTAWVAKGPVHLWVGSVSQDATADPGKQSRATFRDVRFLGMPYTPPAVPVAPVNFQAAPTATSIALSWNIQPGVIGVYLTRNGVNIPLSASASGYLDTSAAAGTNYTYVLKFGNSGGLGGASTVVSTLAVPPAAPANFRATASDGQIVLNWDNPGTLTGITLTRNGIPLNVSTLSATTLTDTGLIDGTLYTYALSFSGPGGNGPASTLTSTPFAPGGNVLPAQAPSVVAGNGSFTARWVIPWGMTSQLLTYTAPSAQAITVPVSAGDTSAEVEGLTPGIVYTVTLVQVNRSGLGAAGTVTVTPTSGLAPSAPLLSGTATGLQSRLFAPAPATEILTHSLKRGAAVLVSGAPAGKLDFLDTGRSAGVTDTYYYTQTNAAGTSVQTALQLTPGPAPAALTYHLPWYGQSLAAAGASTVAITTAPHARNRMFGGPGILRPRGNDLITSVPARETSVNESGMAAGAALYASKVDLLLAAGGTHHDLLISSSAVGGAPISDLKKNGAQPFYQQFMDSVQGGKNLLLGGGYAYGGVPVVNWIHGESAEQQLTASYRADVEQLRADLVADIKSITGQSADPKFVVSQTSSHTIYSHTTPYAAIEQYKSFKAAPDSMILSGPKYQYTYAVDGLHLASASYTALGEKLFQINYELVEQGRAWRPLYPTAVIGAGTAQIDVSFNVPYGPLVLDTTLVTDPGNYGFEVNDASGNVPITGITLQGGAAVRLALGRPLVGSPKLRYAYTGTSGAKAGATTGARGNLRDSDPTVGASGALYNWCVHFEEAVSLPPAPLAPVGFNAVPSAGTVTLGWQNPGNLSGIVLKRDGVTVSGILPADTGYTDTGRTNGTAYSYTLAFVNSGGSSTPASASAVPVSGAAVFNKLLATKYTYYYDVQYGQSLGAGVTSTPPLTIQPHPRAVMMGPNILSTNNTNAYFSTALAENSIGVETGMAAGADTLYRATEAGLAGYATPHMDTLSNSWAVGGQPYTTLAKGQTFYNTLVNSVAVSKNAIAAAGKTLGILWLALIHGENDESARNTAYAANLATWQNDLETDLKAITGQTEGVPFLISQHQAHGAYAHPTPTVDQQMYLAFKANPAKIILVMGKYHLLHTDTDRLHLVNVSSRTMGEKYGQAKASLLTDKPWRPLYPTSVTGAGTSTITATFNVPFGPLQWDTTFAEPHANGMMGFEIVDNTGSITATTTTLNPGSNSVTFALPRPLGVNPRLRYAWTSAINGTAPATCQRPGPRLAGDPATIGGAYGNLCDSDSAFSPYGSNMKNYCVTFEEVIA